MWLMISPLVYLCLAAECAQNRWVPNCVLCWTSSNKMCGRVCVPWRLQSILFISCNLQRLGNAHQCGLIKHGIDFACSSIVYSMDIVYMCWLQAPFLPIGRYCIATIYSPPFSHSVSYTLTMTLLHHHWIFPCKIACCVCKLLWLRTLPNLPCIVWID
jgi:hypothetical protein